MSSSALLLSVNTRVFMRSKKSTIGTITSVITKQNRNNSTSTYYCIKWDNEKHSNNPPLEYATKNIAPFVSPAAVNQQQYNIECQNRVADSAQTPERPDEQTSIDYKSKRRTQQLLSQQINRVYKRVSLVEENYSVSNTSIPSINTATELLDDGSFINQDAAKYEVLFTFYVFFSLYL